MRLSVRRMMVMEAITLIKSSLPSILARAVGKKRPNKCTRCRKSIDARARGSGVLADDRPEGRPSLIKCSCDARAAGII